MNNSLRSQTSRANGAKSQGPKTSEGRAHSAQNSVSHGIFKSPFVLRNEKDDGFLQVEAAFQQEWLPLGPTESTLLDQMVICTWRLHRIWQTEAAAIDIQMDQDAAELQKTLGTFDEACRSAVAFQHLADQSNLLDLLQRYERSLSRQFDRAIARLKELQKDRGGYRRKENLQNEPNQPEPESGPGGGSGQAKLPNEPEPAASRPAKLQNEPETSAAKPKFPNELNPARGQLIEISRGDGEVIALLRPEFNDDK